VSHRAISSNRLEAFSDGVFAILITIMVFEIHTPTGYKFSDLAPLRPVLLSYLLSFVYLIIYWNNHHHLLNTVEKPSSWTMWANANLLFWLSLIPFTTSWLGTSGGAKAPAVLYGISLFMPGAAYYLLQRAIIASHEGESTLAKALGRDIKGKLSPVIYAAAIGIAFFVPWVSYFLYGAVALMWVIPDRRIESELNAEHE